MDEWMSVDTYEKKCVEVFKDVALGMRFMQGPRRRE